MNWAGVADRIQLILPTLIVLAMGMTGLVAGQRWFKPWK